MPNRNQMLLDCAGILPARRVCLWIVKRKLVVVTVSSRFRAPFTVERHRPFPSGSVKNEETAYFPSRRSRDAFGCISEVAGAGI